jgi:hypothetical protein
VLAHDAGGLRRTLVKEQVAAPIERSQQRTRDPAGKEPCILEGRDHVVGAVDHERRHRHTGQMLE